MKKTRSQSILRSLLVIFLDPFIQIYCQNFHQYFDSKVGFREVVISSQPWIKMFLEYLCTEFVIVWKIQSDFIKYISGVKNFSSGGKKLVTQYRTIVTSIWSSNLSISYWNRWHWIGKERWTIWQVFYPLFFEKFFTPYMGVKTFQNSIQSNSCKILMNISKTNVSMGIDGKT